MRRLFFVSLAMGALIAAATGARAGCCDVAKVDTETPATTVQICEPGADGSCGGVLFSGALNLGDSQNVCSSGETIVYQEWDDQEAAFAAPITAFCDGGAVEL
jgi:hypothetical protein